MFLESFGRNLADNDKGNRKHNLYSAGRILGTARVTTICIYCEIRSISSKICTPRSRCLSVGFDVLQTTLCTAPQKSRLGRKPAASDATTTTTHNDATRAPTTIMNNASDAIEARKFVQPSSRSIEEKWGCSSFCNGGNGQTDEQAWQIDQRRAVMLYFRL